MVVGFGLAFHGHFPIHIETPVEQFDQQSSDMTSFNSQDEFALRGGHVQQLPAQKYGPDLLQLDQSSPRLVIWRTEQVEGRSKGDAPSVRFSKH